MKSNKLINLLLVFVILMPAVSVINVKAFWFDPGDPPPTTTNVYGYIKDGFTGAKIYNARVKIYDRNTNEYFAYDYTDSNGYFYISNVPDVNHKIYVTKSNYVSMWFNVYSNGATYNIDPTITVRFIGDIRENEIIDNIEVPLSDPCTLDITPTGLSGYSNLINDISVEIKVYDWRNNLIRTSTTTNGLYDTGSFTIRKGTITIKATAYEADGRKFLQGIVSEYATISTTYTKNFILDRDLGYITVSADEYGEDILDNFRIKLLDNNYHWVDVDLYAKYAPNIYYNPFYTETTRNVIETKYSLTGFQASGGSYYTPYYVTQKLYVYNHWSNEEESFIDLTNVDCGSTVLGTGRIWSWSVSGSIGYSFTETFGASLSFGLTSTPPDGVDIQDYHTTVFNPEMGCCLGYVTVDYQNAWQYLEKDITSHWLLDIDNLDYMPHKQCGSHLTFKILTEIRYRQHMPIVGWQHDEWIVQYIQTIGDDQLTHPEFFEIGPRSIDEYTFGEIDGDDFWMNLLAGQVEDLPV